MSFSGWKNDIRHRFFYFDLFPQIDIQNDSFIEMGEIKNDTKYLKPMAIAFYEGCYLRIRKEKQIILRDGRYTFTYS